MKTEDENSEKADVAFFTSLGAGFGVSGGTVTEILDEDGNVLETKFKNTLGLHLGALFSRDDNVSIVAPILTGTFLDFQLGVGYELGKIQENQERFFVTIAYAIPLHKLTNTNFYIWLSDERSDREHSFSKSAN